MKKLLMHGREKKSKAHFTRLMPLPVSYAADGGDPVPSPARAAADGPDRPTRRGRHMPRTLASRHHRAVAFASASPAGPHNGRAKISSTARCGPHGDCGDSPVGAKWVSGGAGSTSDPAIGCLCGHSRAPHVTPVRSPPLLCRLLPPPSSPACSLSAAGTVAAVTVNVTCLHKLGAKPFASRGGCI